MFNFVFTRSHFGPYIITKLFDVNSTISHTIFLLLSLSRSSRLMDTKFKIELFMNQRYFFTPEKWMKFHFRFDQNVRIFRWSFDLFHFITWNASLWIISAFELNTINKPKHFHTEFRSWRQQQNRMKKNEPEIQLGEMLITRFGVCTKTARTWISRSVHLQWLSAITLFSNIKRPREWHFVLASIKPLWTSFTLCFVQGPIK